MERCYYRGCSELRDTLCTLSAYLQEFNKYRLRTERTGGNREVAMGDVTH
jgi:hypothetical protein